MGVSVSWTKACVGVSVPLMDALVVVSVRKVVKLVLLESGAV